MEVIYAVAGSANLSELQTFADQAFQPPGMGSDERTLALWHVPWRKEALEHYLRLGWSFLAREGSEGPICGFFLAQPFIHFRGQTQTLWIENIQASRPEIVEELAEIAIRIGREKHLQRILFAPSPHPLLSPSHLNAIAKKWGGHSLTDSILEIHTTKN
jgi:hypothetical protein